MRAARRIGDEARQLPADHLDIAALDAYRRAVDERRETLEEGAAPEAAALLRGLIDRIEIRAKGRGRPPEVTSTAAWPISSRPRSGFSSRSGRRAMVAGDRCRRCAGSALPLLPIACRSPWSPGLDGRQAIEHAKVTCAKRRAR